MIVAYTAPSEQSIWKQRDHRSRQGYDAYDPSSRKPQLSINGRHTWHLGFIQLMLDMLEHTGQAGTRPMRLEWFHTIEEATKAAVSFLFEYCGGSGAAGPHVGADCSFFRQSKAREPDPLRLAADPLALVLALPIQPLKVNGAVNPSRVYRLPDLPHFELQFTSILASELSRAMAGLPLQVVHQSSLGGPVDRRNPHACDAESDSQAREGAVLERGRGHRRQSMIIAASVSSSMGSEQSAGHHHVDVDGPGSAAGVQEHRHYSGKGTPDIQIMKTFRRDGTLFRMPYCIIEVGKADVSRKVAQMFAYAENIFPGLVERDPDNNSNNPCQLGLYIQMLDSNLVWSLFGYCHVRPLHLAAPVVIGDVLLASGTAKNLDFALTCAVAFCLQEGWSSFPCALDCPTNVVLTASHVYKFYRDGTLRTPNASLFDKISQIPAVVHEFPTPSCPFVKCKILVYPFLTGLHAPSMAILPIRSVVHVAQQLQLLHQDGYAHGDIRGGNVVFAEYADAESAIIDFDLARRVGSEEAFYPREYTVDGLGDGMRHWDAQPGKPMHRSHDVFSLHFILAHYECKDNADVWKRALECIEFDPATKFLKLRAERSSSLIHFLALCNSISDFSLTLLQPLATVSPSSGPHALRNAGLVSSTFASEAGPATKVDQAGHPGISPALGVESASSLPNAAISLALSQAGVSSTPMTTLLSGPGTGSPKEEMVITASDLK
jgi:hypothetical protein